MASCSVLGGVADDPGGRCRFCLVRRKGAAQRQVYKLSRWIRHLLSKCRDRTPTRPGVCQELGNASCVENRWRRIMQSSSRNMSVPSGSPGFRSSPIHQFPMRLRTPMRRATRCGTARALSFLGPTNRVRVAPARAFIFDLIKQSGIGKTYSSAIMNQAMTTTRDIMTQTLTIHRDRSAGSTDLERMIRAVRPGNPIMSRARRMANVSRSGH